MVALVSQAVVFGRVGPCQGPAQPGVDSRRRESEHCLKWAWLLRWARIEPDDRSTEHEPSPRGHADAPHGDRGTVPQAQHEQEAPGASPPIQDATLIEALSNATSREL